LETFATEEELNSNFWTDATRYAHAGKDESFVEEVAYVMVTLHQTGA